MSSRQIDIDIVARDMASNVFKRVQSNLSSMSGGFVQSLSGMHNGLHRYNSAMSKLHRTTQVALGGAGYFVYKFTKDATRQFADFERQHAKTIGAIASNYDRSAKSQQKFFEDQSRLKRQALQIGTTGPNGNGALYGAPDVAMTQTALSKAGIGAKQVPEITPSIIKFAGGNDLPLETATEYAVNIGEMFNIPRTKKAYTQMLDKVTKSADISTIDVPDIFQSLKYAGPIASSLHRSLDEVLGVISVMGNSGLKGSMAGTGIQAFFTKILSPTPMSDKAIETAPSPKAVKTLETFVASTTDKSGKFKSMPDVTKKLDDALNGLNDKEQAWFSRKLFGLYQMKSAYTLGKNGGDNLADTIKRISTTSEGTNDKKWNIMLESAWGKQQALKNAWTGTKIDVGYRLAPFTSNITEQLFKALTSKGTHKFDFNKIKQGLDASSKMIAEQYGERAGGFVSKVGNFAINGAQIGKAVSPVSTGFGLGYMKLLGGDIPGALKSFKDGISDANKNIGELPPELQTMATEVKNATTTLAVLAGVNFVAKFVENITKFAKFLESLATPKTPPAPTTPAPAVTQMLKSMNVRSNIVHVYGNSVIQHGGGGIGGGTPGAPVPGGKTYKDGTPKVPGYYKDGTPKIPGYNKDGTPRKGTKAYTEQNPPPPPPPTRSQKLSKIGRKGLTSYALLEMFGINDILLDKTPAKHGTKAREVLDKGRSAVDWTLTGAFLDSVLLNGAIKRNLIKGISSGAPKIGTAISEMASKALTNLSLDGLPTITAGAGAVPLAVAGYTIYNHKNKVEKQESRGKQIEEHQKKGRKTYISSDGSVTYMPSKSEKDAHYNKHKYEYGGGESQTYLTTAPTKPATSRMFLHPIKYTQEMKEYNKEVERYKANLLQIEKTEKMNKSKFSLAQSIYQKNTGQKLEWKQYEKNKGSWDKIIPNNVATQFTKFSGNMKTIMENLASASASFKQLQNLPKDKNGNVDAKALSQALDNIAKNSSELSSNLNTIANTGAQAVDKFGTVGDSASKISQDMANISGSATVISQLVQRLPSTGDRWQDAMNAGKFAGQLQGTKFDFGAFAEKLNPLNAVSNNTSSIMGKLDPINSSIGNVGGKLDTVNSSIKSIPPPTVTVNVPAPNVHVNVDKSGNTTTSTSGPSFIQSGGTFNRLWGLAQSRFGK